MEKTLKIINDLKKQRLITDYAIGGGIAAIFYIEPILTYDLDIFIVPVEKRRGKKIISLTPIFDYLKHRKYIWRGEHIVIAGIPVQFIPADKLEEEAVKHAKRIRYNGVPTKLIAPEYLVAVLLRAGRKKDFDKIEKILDQAKVDKTSLNDILKRYDLLAKFRSYIKEF